MRRRQVAGACVRSRQPEEASMAEHPNVQRIRDAYATFMAGDLNGTLKDHTPDGVFHFNGEGPNSGDHRGVEGVTKALVATFETTGGTQVLDIKSVFADDHHGVVVLHETASRPDGANSTSTRCTCSRSTAKVASPISGTCRPTPTCTTGSSTGGSPGRVPAGDGQPGGFGVPELHEHRERVEVRAAADHLAVGSEVVDLAEGEAQRTVRSRGRDRADRRSCRCRRTPRRRCHPRRGTWPR